jgi:hypothetical protein
MRRRSLRLFSLSSRPASSCESGEYVRIDGLAVLPSPLGETGPFSRRAAAWVRAVVFENTGQASQRLEADVSVPAKLWLDDSSGRLACIEINRARVFVERKTIASTGVGLQPSSELQATLLSLGVETSANGITRSLRCEEERIAPGERLQVSGMARVTALPGQDREVLVLDLGDEASDELIVNAIAYDRHYALSASKANQGPPWQSQGVLHWWRVWHLLCGAPRIEVCDVDRRSIYAEFGAKLTSLGWRVSLC